MHSKIKKYLVLSFLSNLLIVKVLPAKFLTYGMNAKPQKRECIEFFVQL
jgi:hypothetical protein